MRCGSIIVLRSAFAVKNLLAERGVTVSYETIRQWCLTFGSDYARRIKKHQGPAATVATFGEPWTKTATSIEILLQKRKDTNAAQRFFRKTLRSQLHAPFEITTARGFRTSRRVNKKGRCEDFGRTNMLSDFCACLVSATIFFASVAIY